MLLKRVWLLASMATLVPAVAFAQELGGRVDPTGIITRALGVLQGPMGLGLCLLGLIGATAGAVFGHQHRGLYAVGSLIFAIFCGGWLMNTIVGAA